MASERTMKEKETEETKKVKGNKTAIPKYSLWRNKIIIFIVTDAICKKSRGSILDKKIKKCLKIGLCDIDVQRHSNEEIEIK